MSSPALNFLVFRFIRDLCLFLTIPIAFQISLLGQFKAGTDASSSLVNQMLGVSVFAGGLYLAIFGRISLRTILRSMAPMAAFLVLALISVFWSDYPSLSLRRSSHLMLEAISLVLIALAYREEPEKLLTRLFYIFGIITLADAVSWFIPSISSSRIGFMGIHENKNQAGAFFLCAIPLFALATRYFSGMRTAASLLFLIACGLLALTESKTAVTSITLGIPLTLALRFTLKSKGRGRTIVPFIYLMICSAVLLFTLNVGIDVLIDKVFGDPTLTGRVRIWQFALTKFDAEPLHGIGFGALWQTGYDIARYLSQYNVNLVNEAHNGYIDIMAQLGVLGLISLVVFLIVVFIRLCRTMSRYKDDDSAGIVTYALFLFISGLIYNTTESSYFRPGISQWVMLILVLTCATGRLLETFLLRPARRHFTILNLRALNFQFYKK